MASISSERASSSSSSSSAPGRKHDVYLSFRGEDTHDGFTDHLYEALRQKRIHAFRDEEKLLREGELFALDLMKAIEESQYAIIVLSKNYADSKWCLDELAKIVETREKTGLTVLPVFYYVETSDVRNQTGSFAIASAEHEKDNIEKIQKWRAALTEVGNLPGWHLNHR
ncbi:hypothetical protein RGQ29_018262 [Quercus rubra]|uniref:TIR domain-containing protein n=1 Tax=Quercus rubra TaxID=3512 RepID=A0AAN7J1P3_QUERU|nr:hypothetical protein RGQ29_018262 [Quercus rubra]